MTTTRPRTTLSQDEEAIAEKQYGEHAKPSLFEDKSVEGLIKANCPEKGVHEAGWVRFAKMISV